MEIKLELERILLEDNELESGKRKQKDSFWPSEAEKPLFDIYHAWMGDEPTNPIEANKLVMFSAAKMMELALIGKLQKAGILKKTADQEHFVLEREGITISGYTDGRFVDGRPIEFKTFYGSYQEKELRVGKPKTSYLKQLAIYMDATDQDEGVLLYMDRGTGELYEFTLHRIPNTLKFHCLEVEFDLGDTYKKWAKFYKDCIVGDQKPDYLECGLYKADPTTHDWSKVSKSDISEARNGRKVIGSDRENHWKLLYSPYKDLIVAKQGQTPGYTPEELEQVKTATKGYSSKK